MFRNLSNDDSGLYEAIARKAEANPGCVGGVRIEYPCEPPAPDSALDLDAVMEWLWSHRPQGAVRLWVWCDVPHSTYAGPPAWYASWVIAQRPEAILYGPCATAGAALGLMLDAIVEARLHGGRLTDGTVLVTQSSDSVQKGD